ncbi:TetR/AcrR family transcriptional regulator [Pseudomonas sp. MSSRFD41]|uniref:TetR/AcrR family transcriptional regulator n=1 Tax=Pseudomonas sp. MSSRFD41 TaxID=1310370 RepID=UPI00163A7C2C|nr:TetR/AcrR family transcriptional regulator [Pseudomonas sp. MSSRFD41]MBC2658774.1 TetR/AcrR family transcriptional regulator [Pseudomonas sp. MSSRFD41]
MRYSAGHKQQTRERLLQSSAVQAKDEGFSTVGVDALMKAIGLSGGAFYSHFASKDELFGSIVERELRQSLERLGGNGQHDREKLRRCLKQYLSMAHVQQPGAGCALPALGAEVSRGAVEVRQQAEDLICRLHQAWAQTLGSDSLAWSILAQCVGALVVARMLVSPSVQSQLLAGNHEQIIGQLERLPLD